LKFDINLHIKNHAYHYQRLDTPTDTDLHFKFSILDLYFYANSYTEIEKKLEEILQDLLKPTTYIIHEKNGFYTNKEGKRKQRYANRKITIDLKKYLTALAIHTLGAKGEYTQDHFHFLVKKNARLGFNYSHLRHHISKVLEKHGLIAHFDEMDDYKYTNLAKSVSKFFWQLKKQTDREFEKYIAKNPDKLTKYLDLLYSYAKTSNRLDYFFKTMQILRKRLNKLDIDFEYQGHNIRYSYPISFILENPENNIVIKLLQDKKYTQKDIKSYIDNPILRDAVRFSIIDKKGAYIIGEIKHNTKLLDNFKANKTLANNFLKLLKKELQTTKTKTQLKEQGKLEYISAFKKALSMAKNEKELREILKEKYDFKFKKRKGKTIGFVFNNTYLSIKDLGFKDISEIRQVLISNNQQHTENRSETLKIDYKTEKNAKNLQKRREYYLKSKINIEKLKEIYELTQKLNIKLKTTIHSDNRIQQQVQLDIKLPKIQLNTRNLLQEVKNAKHKRTIRNNINSIERHTRELREVSKRKCRIKNEDKIIRTKINDFRTRIRSSIETIGKAIGATITNTIQSIRENLKRIIKQQDNYIRENLKLLKNSRLYYRFVDMVDLKLTKEQQQQIIAGTFNPYNDKNFIKWIKSTYSKNDIEEIIKFEKEKLNEQEDISYKPRFKR